MNEIQQLIDDSKAIVAVARKAGRDLTTIESAAIDANLARVEMLKRSEQTTAEVNAFFNGQKRDTGPSPADGTGYLAMGSRHLKAMGAQYVDKLIESGHRKSLVAAGSTAVPTVLLPGVTEEGKPAQSIMDLLPARVVGSPNYQFVRAVSPRQPNARLVEPGAEKPVTPVSVQSVDGKLAVCATVSEPLDKFLLLDNQALSGYVGDELLYSLRICLESEILAGDGSAGHLTGLLSTSGIVSQPHVTDLLTTIRTAIGTLERTGYQPSAVVLSSADWMQLDLMLAASGSVAAQGLPINQAERRIWGVRVVLSEGMGAKTGMVLGEGCATVDVDGRGIDLEVSSEHAGLFSRNQLIIRAELRAGVSCAQPAALVKIGTSA